MRTCICVGQAGKRVHRGQMSHLHGRLESRDGECVRTDIERRRRRGEEERQMSVLHLAHLCTSDCSVC